MITLSTRDVDTKALAGKLSFLFHLAGQPNESRLSADMVIRKLRDSRLTELDCIPSGACPWPIAAYNCGDLREAQRKAGLGHRGPGLTTMVLVGISGDAEIGQSGGLFPKGRYIGKFTSTAPDCFEALRDSFPTNPDPCWVLEEILGPFSGQGWVESMTKAAVLWLRGKPIQTENATSP